MIINKPSEKYIINYDNKQRLGNKTLFNNVVPNQNNVNVRYFSSIDAEIYFEDLYIDECVQINFAVQQQALPLYGYNSYVYDDIALGSRIINGQFSINFTKSAYMYEVLNTLSGITTKAIDEHEPLWNKSFDIYMSYGDARQSNRPSNSTILVLKNVNLVSCSQDLDYTGKPIYETYSFVTRDIDFINEGTLNTKTIDDILQDNTSKEILPVESIMVKVGELDNINLFFTFTKDLIIKSVMYKLEDTNIYTEAIDLTNIDTSQKDTYIVIDTDTPKEKFKTLLDKNQKMIFDVSVEYEDYNGQTNKVVQKLISTS